MIQFLSAHPGLVEGSPRAPGVLRQAQDQRRWGTLGRAAIAALALLALPSPALAQQAVEQRLATYRERVERLEDQLAIENLQADFGYYFDKGLWNEVAALFARDGSFE